MAKDPHPYTTHEVTNQPPALQDYNAFNTDTVLQEGVEREGAGWAFEDLVVFGKKTGSRALIELGFLANENPPQLRTHDRFGHRIDQVRFHPAWHQLMAIGMEAEIHSLPWRLKREGSHVARAAKHYLLSQVEAGVGCPLTMTFAAVPALEAQPDLAQQWIPRITSNRYDPTFCPARDKQGCTMGMAMTEKQGGSDVRANTTQATPLDGGGPGGAYQLTGHKWFCSAPMSDAFLTLAQVAEGLTCFLVPRWQPDGTQNRIFIQRLKDKLGNRSNASSEIEFDQTWAQMVGEPGRGIPTIIEMVNHTRLDCVIGSAALMRQALVQAAHHCRHRAAFGKRLVAQPLMRNVLTDLAVESEAATTLMLHLAGAYDRSGESPAKRAYARLATAIAKYWVCKRTPIAVGEALECLGGAGYVEESILPRLYREAPLSSIWEGSGNVMCLDVVRALQKEPEAREMLKATLRNAMGQGRIYDSCAATVFEGLEPLAVREADARRFVERLALVLQASLLIQHVPECVSTAFCTGRLHDGHGLTFGTLPAGIDSEAILLRMWL
jgi:putative acyl-CoA dehydrogenase